MATLQKKKVVLRVRIKNEKDTKKKSLCKFYYCLKGEATKKSGIWTNTLNQE